MAQYSSDNHESRLTREGGLAQRLDAAGWGLFFIWVGISLLTGISWGVGLLGVAVITLGGQAARKYFGLGLEGLWLVAFGSCTRSKWIWYRFC